MGNRSQYGNKVQTREEAAASIGMSVSKLDKMRAAGDGPRFFSIGSRVLYETSDLEAYMESLKRRASCHAPGHDSETAAPPSVEHTVEQATTPNPDTPLLEPLRSVDQTAELLGTCSKTVRRLIKAKELSVVRVGHQQRIEPSEIRAYIDRNRVD